MNLDIHAILRCLAKERPIFHSEADFQHALAWNIREKHKDAKLRLEVPFSGSSGRQAHVDCMVRLGDGIVYIELKYRKAKLEHTKDDEVFCLKDQSAHDTGRFDFIKDIWRLEELCDSQTHRGIAVLLTNVAELWEKRGRGNTQDGAFRIHEGREINGTLNWREGTGSGTKGKRSDSITLRGCYTLGWHDYSEIEGTKNTRFRYCAVQVVSEVIKSPRKSKSER